MINLKFNKKVVAITLLISIVFAWVTWINFLPTGYVVSSTDHAYFLDIKNAYKGFFYTWTNGVGYGAGKPYNLQAAIPYYSIWRGAAVFDLESNVAQSLYFLLFLFSAFVSFAAALRILFPETRKSIVRFVFSLLYSLNLYTLYLFMHVFGYFYQQVLYVFVPLLIALVYKILSVEESAAAKRYYFLFAGIALIGSMGFNNPGFFVAYVLVILLLSIFVFLFEGHVSMMRQLSGRLTAIFLILFVVNAYWLLPYFAVLRDQATNITDNNAIWTMRGWISWQSTQLSNLFRMMPVTNDGKFPADFYYGAPAFVKSIYNVLSFSYLMLIPLGLLLKKKISKIDLSLISLLVALTLLIAKYKGPLGALSIKVFSWPLFNSLRSYDKFMVFWPAVVLFLVYSLIFANERITTRVKYFIIFVLLLLPLPFYIGRLQQNIALIFKPGENYQTAKYSYLVKVPDDYRRIAQMVNASGAGDFKVQYLPFGVINSPGWSQYPKWKFMGNDITASLFEKPVQRPSNYLNSQQYNYGKLFNSKYNPSWMMPMSGLMNDAFLVFNKDVDGQFLTKTVRKIDDLERQGSLKQIYSGDYADLYEINSKYYLPHFYVPSAIYFGQNVDYEKFPDLLEVGADEERALYLPGSDEAAVYIQNLLSTHADELIKEPEGISVSTVSMFDYNSQSGAMNLPTSAKVYFGGVPVDYKVSVDANKISLSKNIAATKYAAVNGVNHYGEDLYDNLTLKNPGRELVLNDAYWRTTSSTQQFEVSFNRKVPTLTIATDFEDDSENLLIDASFEKNLANGANSCGRGDFSKSLEMHVASSTDATDGQRSLLLESKNGRACSMLTMALSDFDNESYYRFSLDYKSLAGKKVQFGVWQAVAKVRQPDVDITVNGADWHHYEYVFKPKDKTDLLTVFLYADSNGRQEVRTLFDNVILKKVKPKKEFQYPIYNESAIALASSSVRSTIEVVMPESKSKNILVDSSFEKGLGNGANLCGNGDTSLPKKISAEPVADASDGKRSLRLSSANGNACTMIFGANIMSGYVYELSLDYKNIAGDRVKFGIWQPGADVTSPLEDFMVTDQAWHHYQKIFLPMDGADSFMVFLYSDSDGTKDVVNLYDNVVLRPVGMLPQKIYAEKKQRTDLLVPQVITFKKINPTKYKVAVKGARGVFPLVFSEAFHKKWISYAVPPSPEISEKIDDGAGLMSASADERKDFQAKNWITSAADDYVSKNIKGTIQNNNLTDDSLADTMAMIKIESRISGQAHFLANGYANGWMIDTDYLCATNKVCSDNGDGSHDFEMIIEYWPQRLFYLGAIITGAIVFLALWRLFVVVYKRIWGKKLSSE